MSSTKEELNNSLSDLCDSYRNGLELMKEVIAENCGFPSRSFYGETFAMALLNRHERNKHDDKLIKMLWSAFKSKDFNDPEFHWEFNNYALLDYLSHSYSKGVADYLNTPYFKGTGCTNWSLLRIRCMLALEKESEFPRLVSYAERLVKHRQLRNGLIIDNPGVRSFQYHCFSAAMLSEIYEISGRKSINIAFKKSIKFILPFILRDGQATYIGRGQNQSFGYSCLLYILLKASRYERFTLGTQISAIIKRFLLCQRNDGGIPLLMIPNNPDPREDYTAEGPSFYGWYPYNNYYDYFPFTLFFMNKAMELVDSTLLEGAGREEVRTGDYHDRMFTVVKSAVYDAVVAVPGGYWTNDQSIPYVVREKNITPCYGGEQFQPALTEPSDIPLPFFRRFKKSIGWRSWTRLVGRYLVIVGPLGLMVRRYEFYPRRIKVTSLVLSPFSYRHTYLALSGSQLDKFLSENKKFIGRAYSASGLLNKYFCNKFISTCVIDI